MISRRLDRLNARLLNGLNAVGLACHENLLRGADDEGAEAGLAIGELG